MNHLGGLFKNILNPKKIAFTAFQSTNATTDLTTVITIQYF